MQVSLLADVELPVGCILLHACSRLATVVAALVEVGSVSTFEPAFMLKATIEVRLLLVPLRLLSYLALGCHDQRVEIV
jgi:hypothetical protein